MVARTALTQRLDDIKYYGWAVYTVTMSNGDTFTASDFVSTETLKSALLNKNSDGSEVTTTELNNVVTCNQAGVTDQECTLYVYGVRA